MVNFLVEYLCLIMFDFMCDLVIVVIGQMYDRMFIIWWIQVGYLICFKMGQKFVYKELIFNYVLRSLILQWCEDNNVLFEYEENCRISKKGVGI